MNNLFKNIGVAVCFLIALGLVGFWLSGGGIGSPIEYKELVSEEKLAEKEIEELDSLENDLNSMLEIIESEEVEDPLDDAVESLEGIF